MNTREMIEEYQCSGCVNSGFDCYKDDNYLGCVNHVPGTYILHIGKLLLGMPKGFNRIPDKFWFEIFEKLEPTIYNKFNVVVWKHLDENGNTLIRAISPRTNNTLIHVIKGNVIDEIDCYEVTKEDIENMD